MVTSKVDHSGSLRTAMIVAVLLAGPPASASEKLAGQRDGLLKMVMFDRLTCGAFMEEPGLATDGRDLAWLCCLSREADGRDRVLVSERRDRRWSQPVSVAGAASRCESPRIACAAAGCPMVVWIRIDGDRWLLESSVWENGAFAAPAPVSSEPGRAANPALAAGPDGAFWLAWESYRNGEFRVRLAQYRHGSWRRPIDATDGRANAYDPALALDQKSGRMWLAFSAVDNEAERAIFLAGCDPAGARLAPPIQVAVGGKWPHGPNCNSYPSVLCDAQGRVWVAYENDSPDRDPTRSCYQGDRRCAAACFHNGKLWEAKASSENHGGRDVLTGRNDHYPFLLADQLGRVWLLARDYHTQTNQEPGILARRRVWHFRASLLDGARGWTEPEMLLDERVRLGLLSRTAAAWLGPFLLAAWQEDNTLEYCAAPNPGGAYRPCKPVFSNICVAGFQMAGGTTESGAVVLQQADPGTRTDLNRIQRPDLRGRPRIDRRIIEARGAKYALITGNLHEHTNLSACENTGADGGFDENYRYARDVHGYDFMAITDHEAHQLYYDAAWRKTIRAADFYNDPPHFVALPAYEFSFINWRSWGKTWVPALGSQILYFGSRRSAEKFVKEDGGVYSILDEQSGDLKKLLALLREKKIEDAVLPPHQLVDYYSVTDWSIRDPQYRTVMEIFQIRGSYEYEGCPRQVKNHFIPGTKQKAAGADQAWAQNALALGQRMGFIACGDHMSTGTGTTALFVREVNREGVMDALKSRRCYATTGDKIFLDFRINGRLMGEEIKTNDKPRITAAVEGSDALREIVVFKNNKPIYEKKEDSLHGAREHRVDFVDADFAESSCYYLRAIQRNNEIAWASPIWVE